MLKTVSLPIEPNLKLDRRLLFRSDDDPCPGPKIDHDPDPGPGPGPNPTAGLDPKINPDEEGDDDDVEEGNPACGPNLKLELELVFVSKLLLRELLWIEPCSYELEDGIDACLCPLAGVS